MCWNMNVGVTSFQGLLKPSAEFISVFFLSQWVDGFPDTESNKNMESKEVSHQNVSISWTLKNKIAEFLGCGLLLAGFQYVHYKN